MYSFEIKKRGLCCYSFLFLDCEIQQQQTKISTKLLLNHELFKIVYKKYFFQKRVSN